MRSILFALALAALGGCNRLPTCESVGGLCACFCPTGYGGSSGGEACSPGPTGCGYQCCLPVDGSVVGDR